MRTWVLKIEGHYDLLLYGAERPSLDDVREILIRRGIISDVGGAAPAMLLTQDRAFDFGVGRTRSSRGIVEDSEERRQRRRLSQLWREAREEAGKESERHRAYNHSKRQIQDRSHGVSVVARIAERSAQGADAGAEGADGESAGGADRSAGEEYLIRKMGDAT